MRKLFHEKTPSWLKLVFPGFTWDLTSTSKSVFLTFDDGPVYGVTDKALDLLKKYNAKATFFCIGSNVKKNPELFNRIIEEGHDVGNHTFNHLKGWTTGNDKYIHDVEKADKYIQSKLFRPPFGKISPLQAQKLKKNYQIILWDIMSFDYDQDITPEQCASNVIRNIEPGSIVTFHDSIQASTNMLYALEETLKFCNNKFDLTYSLNQAVSKSLTK